MNRRAKCIFASLAILLVCLAGCSAPKPEVEPLSLKVPSPPDPHPGGIVVYGNHLPSARVDEITRKIRANEADLLADYEQFLLDHPGTEGRVQVRIAINKKGEVPQVDRVYSEVSSALTTLVREQLAALKFAAGPQAYVYYTPTFKPDPFETLHEHPAFDETPPALLVTVENRTSFHIPVVSATVTVYGPDTQKPLRIYRRRFAEPFEPGERRELRIPVGGEWATERNSFLVTVRPAPPKAEHKEGD
jgi:hypothetical protein